MSTLEKKQNLIDRKILTINKIAYKDAFFSLDLLPLKEEDAEAICFAILSSLKDLQQFMDWSHHDLSIEKQLERIQASRRNFLKGLSYDFSVFDSSSGDFLMTTSLNTPRVPNKKSLGVGYWTSSKYSNRGLATIATKILTILAFEVFDCDRVEIGCNKENKKSIRVIEKCNFLFEGEFRNYFSAPTATMVQKGFCQDRTGLIYALTKQDIDTLFWYKDILTKIVVS